MKKFDAVLLVDCWTPNFWKDEVRARNQRKFHSNLLSFLRTQEFDQVLFATKGLPLHITDPRLKYKVHSKTKSNRELHVEDVVSYYDLYKNLQDKSNILFGGAAWKNCVHGNHIGLYELMDEKNLTILSHPSMVDSSIDNEEPITKQDFENDWMIEWLERGDGFYHAARHRKRITKSFRKIVDKT